MLPVWPIWCWLSGKQKIYTIYEVVLYKRYIDDIILIWEGPSANVESFLERLDHNYYDLGFTGEWSLDQVKFLDIILFKKEGKILTKTYFKDTARNCYIPTTSCHHKK